MPHPVPGKEMDPGLRRLLEKPHNRGIVDAPKSPEVLPATTVSAANQLAKAEKKKRDFPTFIEKSLPERDRE